MMATYYISVNNGAPFMCFYENYFICTTLEALAIFIFVYNHYKSGKFDNFFSQMSKRVIGIYIIHVLIMSIFTDIGLNPTTFNPIVFIPIYSILVFMVSYGLVVVIQKIPFVNKWIL